jgi:hypothetical protein
MRILDPSGPVWVIARSAPSPGVRASFNFKRAPVLAGVNVVRPVGRSTFDTGSGPARPDALKKEAFVVAMNTHVGA